MIGSIFPRMLQQIKARGRILGLTLILAAILVWLFQARHAGSGFDWTAFRATFRQLDWWWITQALGWAWSTYLIRALRWRVLLHPVQPGAPLGPLLSATIIGFAAVTILGRAGEMVRPYLIAKNGNIPFATQLAAWIVERIYDTLVALVIFGFAMTQVSASNLGPTLSWALGVGGLVIVTGTAACLGILVLMRYRSRQVEQWALRTMGFLAAHHFIRVEKLIISFLNGFRSVRSQGAATRMVLYTVAEWMLVGACYACVIRAFGSEVHMSPVDVLVLMGFATFGSLVQLPAVGGGVQVTVVLVLTEIYGVRFELATSIGLMIWFMLWVSILPLGAALALREGLTWARVREASRSTIQ